MKTNKLKSMFTAVKTGKQSSALSKKVGDRVYTCNGSLYILDGYFLIKYIDKETEQLCNLPEWSYIKDLPEKPYFELANLEWHDPDGCAFSHPHSLDDLLDDMLHSDIDHICAVSPTLVRKVLAVYSAFGLQPVITSTAKGLHLKCGIKQCEMTAIVMGIQR